MLLNQLENKDKAYTSEDMFTEGGFLIPTGTKIKVVNMLRASALIDILPHRKVVGVDRLVYKRCIVRSQYMFINIKRTK